jgi:hypothetical protein
MNDAIDFIVSVTPGPRPAAATVWTLFAGAFQGGFLGHRRASGAGNGGEHRDDRPIFRAPQRVRMAVMAGFVVQRKTVLPHAPMGSGAPWPARPAGANPRPDLSGLFFARAARRTRRAVAQPDDGPFTARIPR